MSQENDKNSADVLFSKSILNTQKQLGSAEFMQKKINSSFWKNKLSPEQVSYIESRQSFYLSTSSVEGQPYMQHRGGHIGFLKVEDESILWFPNYRGNKQFITLGNLAENDQAFIFLMDYSHARRLKLWGKASVVNQDELTFSTSHLDNMKNIEQFIVFKIQAIDENCRQYIPKLNNLESLLQELNEAKSEIRILKAQLNKREEFSSL